MRQIINSTYITLDGVITDPQLWPSFPVQSVDPRANEIQTELILACDILIMGRSTYDGFAAVWPSLSGDPFSDHINAMRKIVVSSTLTDPEWNNTTAIDPADAVSVISELKRSDGGDILQYGVGQLTYLLMEHGLVDDLRVWVHPFFLGNATTADLMFRPGSTHLFELAGTTTLTTGTVILHYNALAGDT
jgi:dihydrofolate reductase